MTKAILYPKADHVTQWWEDTFSRATFTVIEKILWHTTETTGFPSYKSGSEAPTLTYHAGKRIWRQHNRLNTSARALVDPTSTPVRENRDNVIQVEIICYTDEKVAATVNGGIPVSKLSDDNLRDLAEFVAFVRAEWGGPPNVAVGKWYVPFPESNTACRMSSAVYDAAKGMVGHMHASGNGHGDPGLLDVNKIVRFVNEIENKKVEVPPVTIATDLIKPLYDRVFGMLRQRYVRADGSVTGTAENGAVPTRVLDTADGASIQRNIDAVEAKVDELLTRIPKV